MAECAAEPATAIQFAEDRDNPRAKAQPPIKERNVLLR
jgi:hypothetical protein